MNKENPYDKSDLVGVGLRQPHYSYVFHNKPKMGWFEVHSENFFQEGGAAPGFLKDIRDEYPISLHGVGLSLGSADGIDTNHLKRLKELVLCFTPFLLSDHLSWSRVGKVFLPDLLPVPYTDESLEIFARNIDQAQSFIGREMMIENPSSYIEYKDSTFGEVEFLTALCKRTGSKILLDINNIYVSAMNHGWNPEKYIDSIPIELVGEIHLAGHLLNTFEDGTEIRIDTHGSYVCPEVWALFDQAVKRGIRVPTLIEWDTDIPEFHVLEQEAERARNFL